MTKATSYKRFLEIPPLKGIFVPLDSYKLLTVRESVILIFGLKSINLIFGVSVRYIDTLVSRFRI